MKIRTAYQKRNHIDLNDPQVVIDHLRQLYTVEGADGKKRDTEIFKFCNRLVQFGYSLLHVQGMQTQANWTSPFGNKLMRVPKQRLPQRGIQTRRGRLTLGC